MPPANRNDVLSVPTSGTMLRARGLLPDYSTAVASSPTCVFRTSSSSLCVLTVSLWPPTSAFLLVANALSNSAIASSRFPCVRIGYTVKITFDREQENVSHDFELLTVQCGVEHSYYVDWISILKGGTSSNTEMLPHVDTTQ